MPPLVVLGAEGVNEPTVVVVAMVKLSDTRSPGSRLRPSGKIS